MGKRELRLWFGSLLFFVVLPASAQSSTSYRLEEYSLNAGGGPEQGVESSSSGYRLSVDALGELSLLGVASAGFALDAGLTAAYPPPLEVDGLRFHSQTDFDWNPYPGAGSYNVYRGALPDFQPAYGSCWQAALTVAGATDADPVVGNGFFYLVTAENRLQEEGSKGFNDLEERSGNACVP